MTDSLNCSDENHYTLKECFIGSFDYEGIDSKRIKKTLY